MFKRLCLLSVVSILLLSSINAYARRFKHQIPVFNYQTLVDAINSGDRLVTIAGHPLNNIPSNFRGRYALYYLAQEIENAVNAGIMAWQGELTSFQTARLNRLSNEFISSLNAVKTARSYDTFFEWKDAIEGDLDRYRGNEGQINFAFDYGCEQLSCLYDIFGAQYGWMKLHAGLDQVAAAVDLFDQHEKERLSQDGVKPSIYAGELGLRELAEAVDIRHPYILYYARGYFDGYSDQEFNWSWDVFGTKEEYEIEKNTIYLTNLTGIDIKNVFLIVQRDLYNLAHEVGVDRVADFIQQVGSRGISFMELEEGFVRSLFDVTGDDLASKYWEGYVNNYLDTISLIDECCKLYGSEAMGISVDSITQKDYLLSSETQVKEALLDINRAILADIFSSSTVLSMKETLEVQNKFLIVLKTLHDYKNDALEEMSIQFRHPSSIAEKSHGRHRNTDLREHAFRDSNNPNIEAIELFLSQKETEFEDLGIIWEVSLVNGRKIFLELTKDKKRDALRVRFNSGNVFRDYYIERECFSEVNFKMLIRLFYGS